MNFSGWFASDKNYKEGDGPDVHTHTNTQSHLRMIYNTTNNNYKTHTPKSYAYRVVLKYLFITVDSFVV